MLVLLLASILNAAVAISFGSIASAPVDDEVSDMPGFTLKDAPFLEVEELEAAVVAKYVVEKISYSEALKAYEESRPSSIFNIFTRNKDPKPDPKPVVAAEEKAPEKTSSNDTATTSKFTLKSEKKTLNADTPPPEVVTTTAAPTKDRKKIVMHDVPHYKNHGANMVHVEPTAARAAKMGAEPAVDVAQSAAKLAEKRAEVESIFHVSKKDSQTSQDADKEVPAKAGYSLLRLFPFLMILLSIAGIAYHKYQVVFQMSGLPMSGINRGLPRFKAKQEDYDDGSFLGIVSSLMGGMAGGNQNAKRSGDFGV